MKVSKPAAIFIIVLIVLIGSYFAIYSQGNMRRNFFMEVASIIMEEDNYWDTLYDYTARKTQKGEVFSLLNQEDVAEILVRLDKNEANLLMNAYSAHTKERIKDTAIKYKMKDWQY